MLNAESASGCGGRGGLLGKEELLRVGIVVEQFRVAAPVDRRFELRLGFLFAEVLVQQVLEELVGQRVVGLAPRASA